MLQDLVDNDAESSRVYLRDGLVYRDNAAGMERGIAFVFFGRQKLRLRMHHLEFATIIVEFDFAKERHAGADGEAIGKVRPVEPFAENRSAGGISECSFEKAKVAATET